MKVGLIGAGLMGHGMALNLLKHGHDVSVFAHRNRAPVDDLVSRGAKEAPDLAQVARGREIILLCLSTSAVVEDTVRRLTPHLRSGQCIVDAGTSQPESTRRLALELSSLGIGYADAPLTGGPEQAATGELGVLCGADEKTFAILAPLLECFATTIRHMGPPGSGHTAKLISNYLVTGMIALVAEAFAAASKAGIDACGLYEAMLKG